MCIGADEAAEYELIEISPQGSAGGLSDHLVVKKEHVVLLPDSISLEIGGQLFPSGTRSFRIL